ncbi:MAG: WYL domain-containing protein, partial [Bacteroidales bacterium]|nr:WYL domain-containing protein [Bacteroidales bacterium]
MNRQSIIRLRVIDQCLRDTTKKVTFEYLAEKVNSKLEELGYPVVSDRSIREDIKNIQMEPYCAELDEGARDGRTKIYRYRDPEFSLMRQIYPDELKRTLGEAMEIIGEWGDTPQLSWVKSLLQQLSVGADISGAGRCISFQNNPDLRGLEQLNGILEYALAKRAMVVEYEPFGREREQMTVHPYMLKQWNDRWFVMGYVEERDYIVTLPIDRIVSYAPAEEAFIAYEGEGSVEEYFDDVVGVTVISGNPVETVRLRVRGSRYPYIETKPLHWSQKLIKGESDEEWKVVEIRVRMNRELTAMLIGYGGDVEVVSPEGLREWMKKEVRKMTDLYGEGEEGEEGEE